MRVVDIIPKDITILTEFSVEEVQSLLFCMDRTEVTIDHDSPEEVQKMKYFTEIFYKTLVNLEEKVRDVN